MESAERRSADTVRKVINANSLESDLLVKLYGTSAASSPKLNEFYIRTLYGMGIYIEPVHRVKNFICYLFKALLARA